jgi:pyruvate kinase
MITNPVPTRAEVSDIFNAVGDGASALMVTNETAVGSCPEQVIRYLKRTAETAVRFYAGAVPLNVDFNSACKSKFHTED